MRCWRGYLSGARCRFAYGPADATTTHGCVCVCVTQQKDTHNLSKFLANGTVVRCVLLVNNIRLTALCPGLPRRAGTRKVKPIWILLEQEPVSGSGISWAICKSAPCSRQITTPAPHHSVFTGRMPFLPPNQQRQSTECVLLVKFGKKISVFYPIPPFLQQCG